MLRPITSALVVVLALFVPLSLLSSGCGGDEVPTLTISVSKGTCGLCNNPIYTASILQPSGASPCVVSQQTTRSGALTLEGLSFSEGDTVVVNVRVACPADENCSICWGEREVTLSDSTNIQIDLTPALLCITGGSFANPLVGNCP
jgi:hypothetical protein